MSNPKKIALNENQISWKAVDNEIVIINFETSHYFSLNSTGSYIWQLIEKEAATLPQVIKSVSAYFSVDEDAIKDEVNSLIDELLEENLIIEVP
jgi:hypothetical protein